MKTTISQDLISRVAGMTRQDQDWFSPMKPLPPSAPQAEGRMWDFPVGYNTRTQVRYGEGIGFADMRGLADAYDLLRLVIETRKDQLCKLEWQVLPKTEGAEQDAGAKAIQDFLASPDKEHGWDEWLRMLIEDLLVIDAPTIYPRRTNGGEPYSLELIDGAMIKRLIDFTGRTPVPPEPAYQQIIKGLPAVNYTRDELYYRPRNPRTHRAYGYSPVEQIIITVNIALRRQKSQLDYYTEGNIPDALIGVPETWTPEQIRQFQSFWDSLIEGSTAERRHAKFVPGDFKYQPTKEPILKDMYDEWLARVVCFAFSISPQPFVQQMNRATAETAMESALEEGLAPLMRWVIGTMNYILAVFFKRPDLRFEFKNSEAVDPEVQSRIHKTYVEAKVLTPDEVRADLGRKPMSPEERETAWPAPPPVLLGPAADVKEEAGAKEALAKVGKSFPVIDRDRAAVGKCIAGLKKTIEASFRKLMKSVTTAVMSAYSEASKADEDEIARIMNSVDTDGLLEMIPDIEPALQRMAADGALEGLIQLGLQDDVDDMLSLVNEKAVAWAKNRSAELVGMRYAHDGQLVPNPNAHWAITESTRDGIRSLVANALEEGWSNDKLADALSEAYQFSDARAEVIARTETAFADVNGNLIAYRESGIVEGKRSLLAQSDYCPICEGIADEGIIPIDGVFSTGHSGPPYHPACRCDLIPVLKE